MNSSNISNQRFISYHVSQHIIPTTINEDARCDFSYFQHEHNTENSNIKGQKNKYVTSALYEQHKHDWPTRVASRLATASTKLRELLSQNQIGSLIKDFSDLKSGDVVIVANSDNSIDEKSWRKHGYILQVKNTDPLEGNIFELQGGQLIELQDNSFLGEVPIRAYLSLTKENKVREQKLKSELGNKAYFRILESHILNTNEVKILKHLISKERVFKLNDLYSSPELVTKAFKNVYDSYSENTKGYMHYLNNCNHVVADTIKEIIRLQKQ